MGVPSREVGEIGRSGCAAALVGHVGEVAFYHDVVGRVADGNLRGQRIVGQVHDAERVVGVQRHQADRAVRHGDSAGIGRNRVIQVRVRCRRRQGDRALRRQRALERIDVGNLHEISKAVGVVLAEQQFRAVGVVGDACEGPGGVVGKGGVDRNIALDHFAGLGVEDDDRLGRVHHQDGGGFGLLVRVDGNSLGPHRRAELHDSASRRQQLIVRSDDCAVLLRSHSTGQRSLGMHRAGRHEGQHKQAGERVISKRKCHVDFLRIGNLRFG